MHYRGVGCHANRAYLDGFPSELAKISETMQNTAYSNVFSSGSHSAKRANDAFVALRVGVIVGRYVRSQ
jgi:hypothetical protein